MAAIYVIVAYPQVADSSPSDPILVTAFLEEERAHRWMERRKKKYIESTGIPPARIVINTVELDTGAVNAPDDLGADP